MMGTMIQVIAFAFNLVMGIMNYNLGNYGVAMFNTAVAGICLGFFISLISEKS